MGKFASGGSAWARADPDDLYGIVPDPCSPLYPSGTAPGMVCDRSTGREAQLMRRARILAAARSLITAGGMETVTMRDVARLAGVSVQTVYNLAGNRIQLTETAMNEYLSAIVRCSGQFSSYPSVLLAVADLYWAGATRFPDYLRHAALICATSDWPFMRTVRAHQTRLVRAMLRKEYSSDMPVTQDVLSRQISTLTAAATVEWANGAIDTPELRYQLAASQGLALLWHPPARRSDDGLTWLSMLEQAKPDRTLM